MKQYQIDRIKDLMDAKGVTTKELASMCGYSEMTIRRILTPNHNPTTDTVGKIAEALGVHEQYIYEDNGTTPPIDFDLLRSKQIYLFGKLLTFDNELTPPKPVKVKKSNEGG